MDSLRRSILGSALAAPLLGACKRFLRGTEKNTPGYRERVPFVDEPGPLEELIGEGESARYRHDLALLSRATLLTPNHRFFIRTSIPAKSRWEPPWNIRLVGHRVQAHISAADLATSAEERGVHLLECAGNVRPFGLMSVASWRGVAIGPIVRRNFRQPDGSRRILIAGGSKFHPAVRKSWIFSLEELEKQGAFLATHMNHVPLHGNHGYPVRLVVPGWFACTCIKWVDEIRVVADGVEATPHMLAYRWRTHQPPDVTLARDFLPAALTPAAMPVLVERSVAKGKLHVTGIVWGGSGREQQLEIRMGAEHPWQRVDELSVGQSYVWRLWRHTFLVASPGRYTFDCRILDATVPTVRLNQGWYRRSIVL